MDDERANWGELRPRRLRPHETRGDELVSVLVPRFHRAWLVRLSKRLGLTERRVNLDAQGSLVWSLCDGAHSVEEIGCALADRFGEAVKPVEERLPRFLSQLAQHEMIALED